jgi:hypothetical protein
MSLFVKAMDTVQGKMPAVVGENGTLEYSAEQTGLLVSLFTALVRNIPKDRLQQLYRDCKSEATRTENSSSVADLFVLAFQTRDCRGGKGERTLFYNLLIELFASYPQTVLNLVPFIANYGYYKDFMNILSEIGMSATYSPLRDRILDVVTNQLIADEAVIEKHTEKKVSKGNSEDNAGPSITLCAKYMPRESNKWQTNNKEVFRLLLERLFPSETDYTHRKVLYRKLITKLTAVIDIPEVKMCGKRFAEIEFDKVPSICMKKNRKAFANEKLKGDLKPSETETGNRSMEEDRILCRQHLLEALKDKKIKGKQNMPHEIVHLLMDNRKQPSEVEKDIFQNQWEAIKNDILSQMKEKAGDQGLNLGRLVPLVDVSGSMQGTPMEVAIALGILISEVNHPHFRDRFITFETSPSWCDLSTAGTIVDKVRIARHASWGGSTDIEKAFQLIEDAITKFKIPPVEIPDLIIFSDMQFDTAVGGEAAQQSQLTRIGNRFAALGKKLYGTPLPAPKIIFWNLRGDTEGFPATADSENVIMLSGFSPSLFKHLLDGTAMEEAPEKKKPTPWDIFRKAMDDERYHAVRTVLSDSQEGELGNYSFTAPPPAPAETAEKNKK